MGRGGGGVGGGGLASKNVCRRFAAFFFFADELEPSETPANMELKCHNCLRNNASNKVMVIFFLLLKEPREGKSSLIQENCNQTIIIIKNGRLATRTI